MHKGKALPEPQNCIQEGVVATLERDARVTVSGYFYAVELDPDDDHRSHWVGKDRSCTCSLGADCPAVQAVARYLQAGGARALDPPPGYYPVAPAECPICGAGVYYLAKLNSRRRGAGWACAAGGERHYWQAHAAVWRELLSQNPWVFPPVLALDGTELYPGLRRDEVFTQEGQPRE